MNAALPAILLDASAILAFLRREPDYERVTQYLGSASCYVSCANLAEVISKLQEHKLDDTMIATIIGGLPIEVLHFSAKQGQIAGFLRNRTKPYGLSLGDRACLATAQDLDLPVLTSDRVWLNLSVELGLNIICLRPTLQ